MYIPFYGLAKDFNLEMQWGIGCNTNIKKINILFDGIESNSILNKYYNVDLTGATLYTKAIQGETIYSKDGIYRFVDNVRTKN